MKLAVDASSLVAEALRRRGRRLIEHGDLELYIAAPTWSETVHELDRRTTTMVEHGRLEASERQALFAEVIALLRRRLRLVSEAEYGLHENLARMRIPRDPSDWPTVAVALAVEGGIWTNDCDFLGCGLPTWTTETLIAQLRI